MNGPPAKASTKSESHAAANGAKGYKRGGTTLQRRGRTTPAATGSGTATGQQEALRLGRPVRPPTGGQQSSQKREPTGGARQTRGRENAEGTSKRWRQWRTARARQTAGGQ